MKVEMLPIRGIYGLENCFITKDGEIYQRVPTNGNRKRIDGCETITRNFKTYKVADIAEKTFKDNEFFEDLGRFILGKIDSGEFKFDENGDLLPPDMSGDIDWSSTTITEKTSIDNDQDV